MSYVSQNSTYQVNYNSPTLLTPRFVFGLTAALLSAVMAAAMAAPLRKIPSSDASDKPSTLVTSTLEESEVKTYPTVNIGENNALSHRPVALKLAKKSD